MVLVVSAERISDSGKGANLYGGFASGTITADNPVGTDDYFVPCGFRPRGITWIGADGEEKIWFEGMPESDTSGNSFFTVSTAGAKSYTATGGAYYHNGVDPTDATDVPGEDGFVIPYGWLGAAEVSFWVAYR